MHISISAMTVDFSLMLNLYMLCCYSCTCIWCNYKSLHNLLKAPQLTGAT